jgi:hypothetical protein
MLPTPADSSPRKRPAPWLLAVLVAALLAAGLAVIVLRDDEDATGEVGAGSSLTTTTTDAPADPSTSAPPTTATTAPVGSDVPPAQRRLFDELMAQTAAIRGLPWKSPLNLRLVSRSELARRLVEVNKRDTNPTQLAAEEATLKLLGFIPPNLDYADLIDRLLAGAVLGFYDPKTRELFVGAGEELDGATKATIVHEMVHALTDQHFNYGPALLALDEADKTEEVAAYSALLEGDARFTETLWMDKHLDPLEALGALLGGGSTEGVNALLQAPEYIQKALYFPYTDGLEFVEGLHGAGGYAAVNAAYRKPPTSTEHILHPATYSAGQGSPSPALPDVAAATGCRNVRTGALGVFDMEALLDQHLAASDAERAAEGWNGDRYAVVRCGNSLGMADRWEADPGTDAGRLFEALGRWARAWSGGRALGADGSFSGTAGAGRVSRNGNRVELVLAQDADTAARLVGALG